MKGIIHIKKKHFPFILDVWKGSRDIFIKKQLLIMMNKFFTLLIVFCAIASSCSSEDTEPESLFKPGTGIEVLPANCNVELVSVNRITADEVTEDAAFGDYFITLKSVKTEKQSITVEGRYARNGTAFEIVTVSSNNIGIDETIIVKISSKDLDTEGGFCLEYVVRVKANGAMDCEYVATDC